MLITRKRKSVLALVAGLGCVAAVVIAGPAVAATSTLPVPQSHAASAATPHCAAKAVLTAEARTAPAPELDCFATSAQALAFATGNPAVASLSDAQVSEVVAGTSAAIPLTSLLMGIDFVNTNYGGASLDWYGNASGCSGYTYSPNTPAGWQNNISSFELVAAGHCNHSYHYDAQYQTGDRKDCTYGTPQTCYYIGALLNDRTQSEYFTS